MNIEIKKAVRQQRKARVDLTGPSGSGKTYTALQLAKGMGAKILVIDSEQSSSSLYADDFEFDVINLPDHTIKSYFAALDMSGGYDVVIVDSISHAWEAVNEEVSNHAKRSGSGNTFKSWGDKGNPLYNELLSKLLKSPAHIIVTMRVKSDYVMEEYTNASGKTSTKPKKIGLAPKFREGGEYEFDLVANINLEHEMIVEKTRMSFLDGVILTKPGPELGKQIADWLGSGAVAAKSEPGKAAVSFPKTEVEIKGRKVEVIVDNPAFKASKQSIPAWTEGNPWQHPIEAPCNYTGIFLCDLDGDTWASLSDAKFRKMLFENGQLTEKDRLAIYWALKSPGDKETALAETHAA